MDLTSTYGTNEGTGGVQDMMKSYEPPQVDKVFSDLPFFLKAAANCTIAAMYAAIASSSSLQVPNIADTFEPGIYASTYEREISWMAKTHYMGYELDEVNPLEVYQYLKEYPAVQPLLEKIHLIVANIYGQPVRKKLSLMLDPEMGDSMLELKLFTGLPVDEEFFKIDREFFAAIEDSGLISALNNLIISHG